MCATRPEIHDQLAIDLNGESKAIAVLYRELLGERLDRRETLITPSVHCCDEGKRRERSAEPAVTRSSPEDLVELLLLPCRRGEGRSIEADDEPMYGDATAPAEEGPQ